LSQQCTFFPNTSGKHQGVYAAVQLDKIVAHEPADSVDQNVECESVVLCGWVVDGDL
jgi:hypothetical protein